MSKHPPIPADMFYCRGCQKPRPLTERIGKYGHKCTHCEGKEAKK